MKRLLCLLIAMPLLAWADDAAAWADPDLALETAEVAPPPPPPPPPAVKKAAALYTLPFHLRPISAGHVVRLDNVLAFYNATEGKAKAAPGASLKGMKEVSILNAGYRIAKDFGVLARIGLANHWPSKENEDKGPTATLRPETVDANGRPKSGTTLTNGLLLFSYTPQFKDGDIRTAFYLGASIPIGSGGGNNADQFARHNNLMNLMVRSAMDNAMFVVNDMAAIGGIGVAYVKHGVTAQAEVTYLEIMRARGEKMQPAEVVKRNLVTGAFVGYAIIPQLSAGVELRYQRWLKPPHLIRDLGDENHKTYNKDVYDIRMHNMVVALGLRGNFKVGEKTFFRPAISYGMGVMGEIGDNKYHLIQLDLPFIL